MKIKVALVFGLLFAFHLVDAAECTISWVPGATAPTDALTGYEVYISGQDCRLGLGSPGCVEGTFGVGATVVSPTATSTTCTEQGWLLSTGKNYVFVKAVNADGKSGASNLACGDWSVGGPCSPIAVSVSFP